MKKIILSFFSVLICFSLLSSFVVSASGVDYDTVLKDTTASELVLNQTSAHIEAVFYQLMTDLMLDDINDRMANDEAQTLLKDSLWQIETNENGKVITEINSPEYTIIEGKQSISWYDMDGVTHQVLIRLQILSSSDLMDVNFFHFVPSPDVSGLYLPLNCLIYTIYHEDGSIARYVVKHTNPSAPIYYAQSDGSFNINSSGWGTGVYSLGRDKQLSLVSGMTYQQRSFFIKCAAVNSIDNNLQIKHSYPSSGYGIRDFNPSDHSQSTPTDNQLINLYIQAAVPTTGYYQDWYPNSLPYYFSYIDTNSSTLGTVLSSDWVQPNQQIYYYNTYVSNDKTVDETNKSTEFNGAFAPVINVPDIDVNALVVGINAALQPTLDLAAAALLDAQADFYANMPDIGLDWSTDLTNNYFDLVPSDPDDPGGGGSGGGSWEAPTYPAVNTSVYIPAEIPTYSTYAAVTIPSTYIEGTGDWFYFGYNLFDDLGLLVFVIPLAILSIFWRFTGGD